MQPTQIINELLKSFDPSTEMQSNSDDDVKCNSLFHECKQKIVQIQENKQKFAEKLSKSQLDTETKTLLQQQDSHFDQLYSHLSTLVSINAQLIQENNRLKNKNGNKQSNPKYSETKPKQKHASIHQQLLLLSQDTNSDANPSVLLNKGANPNFRDAQHRKWTALHYAVFLNKQNFALELLKHPNINPKVLDCDGFSPLYWAAKKSTPKVITALLAMDCDPNRRDMRGMTPLFAAVGSDRKDNIEALLSHPSLNINLINQFGGSVLHHTAYATDSVEIADLLVQAGGDLFLVDYKDKTPLGVAVERKKPKLFEYYKRKMEEIDPNWTCDVFME